MRKYNKTLVENNPVFVGVDVHLKRWHVTIRTFDEEVFSGSIDSHWSALSRLLNSYHPDQVTVVYEAGYFGYLLYDSVLEWGGKAVVTPPSLVPMEYGNRVKTDKRDSRKLALLLSRDMLRANWVPGESLRCHRQVLRRRRQIMGDRVRLQARIKSELVFYGIDIGSGRERWSRRWVNDLWQISFSDSFAQDSFRRLLNMYEHTRSELLEQTRLLRTLSRDERYRDGYRCLTSIPGIGFITAMTILLELGDMSRFSRTADIAAYVGLTPSQYSSGEHIRLGRISRVGNNYLRGLLIEAAWMAIRIDKELEKIYRCILGRSGSKRAIVAIARRLLLRCRRVLLDGRLYEVRTAA